MTHDAIVIGAGPAGVTAALALARQGRSVALVEKTAFPRRKVCGEFISATSIPVLRASGVEEAFRDLAGPEVRRVALFAGERVAEAAMPARHGYGRALGRDVLDTLLVERAAAQGIECHQPARAVGVESHAEGHAVTVERTDGQAAHLRAPILVAAHGSWERGSLPTDLGKVNAPSDMLGFKAHFRSATLAPGTMPLLAFPGGYGGIVWTDDSRLSISCCIRRSVLAELRARHGGSASEALEAHLRASCRGVRETLRNAVLQGPWLATGPIRPGIRPRFAADVFRAGNLAGEAHPVIAEGISMAMQSGALLAQALDGIDLRSAPGRADAGARYARAWHRTFASRIHAARAFAWLAMRPATLEMAVGAVPSLLTLGAQLSGKTRLAALGR